MRLTVTIKDSTDPALREQASKIEAADQALRQSFSGFDVGVVEVEVRKSFDEVGLDVPDAEMRAYAQAISDRADHEIELGRVT